MSTDKLTQSARAVLDAWSEAGWNIGFDAALRAMRAEVEANEALAAAPAEPQQAGVAPAKRLSPFDAVARAMDMASLLAGSVARSDKGQSDAYAARLRSHLVEYIYPPAAPVVPTEAQILTACEVAGLWSNTAASWVDNGAFRRYHEALNRMPLGENR